VVDDSLFPDGSSSREAPVPSPWPLQAGPFPRLQIFPPIEFFFQENDRLPSLQTTAAFPGTSPISQIRFSSGCSANILKSDRGLSNAASPLSLQTAAIVFTPSFFQPRLFPSFPFGVFFSAPAPFPRLASSRGKSGISFSFYLFFPLISFFFVSFFAKFPPGGGFTLPLIKGGNPLFFAVPVAVTLSLH